MRAAMVRAAMVRAAMRAMVHASMRGPSNAAVLAMACAAGFAPGARAEITQPAAAQNARPTRVESMARVVDDAPARTLRCWQQGRLIFEGSGFSLPALPASLRGATIAGAPGQQVHLLDFQHGFCILENRRG